MVTGWLLVTDVMATDPCLWYFHSSPLDTKSNALFNPLTKLFLDLMIKIMRRDGFIIHHVSMIHCINDTLYQWYIVSMVHCIIIHHVVTSMLKALFLTLGMKLEKFSWQCSISHIRNWNDFVIKIFRIQMRMNVKWISNFVHKCYGLIVDACSCTRVNNVAMNAIRAEIFAIGKYSPLGNICHREMKVHETGVMSIPFCELCHKSSLLNYR